MNFFNQLFSCERFVASSRVLRIIAACGLVGVCWGGRAQAESVTSGPNWIEYSGHIDWSLPIGADDENGPDYMHVELSQFDSTLGALDKVTLQGEIDVTWSASVDNTTQGSVPVTYQYSYDIQLDGPYVSPGTKWVEAKLPTVGDSVDANVGVGDTYSDGGTVHATNNAALTDTAALNYFTGPGTVSFQVLMADSNYGWAGSSGNAIQNYSVSWTGDVSVRYDYGATVVPTPAAVWGGGSLLALMGLAGVWRRRTAQHSL